MAFSWYGNPIDTVACNLGPLALIHPLLKRMKIAGIIDQHLPKDSRAEFSHGTVLSLLIAARLYAPTALMNVATWAGDSGADLLWEMDVEKMTDDRFGRSLDAFFAQRHSILAHLALHVSQEFGVPLSELHYDPTHILFEGAYEDAEPREGVVGEGDTIRSDTTLEPAHITKGRATDDAPRGARMIHVGLCTHVDEFGPIPIFGHTVDGNQNGRTAVDEQFALIRKHLRPTKLTMFSDRGTFSAGHLHRLNREGFHAVCSAPWDEFRPLFDEHRQALTWKEAGYLSIEQQRRRKDRSALPQEHYQLASVPHELFEKESKQSVACRVIFVFSTADQKVVRQQRQKQIDKLQAGLEAIRRSVSEGRNSTDPDAVARRVQRLFGTNKTARYFTWAMLPLDANEQATLPPPARGCKRPTQRFAFTLDQAAVEADETYDGYSVLVATVPETQATDDALFSKFKQQNFSEHANRQFKGPLAVRPVFLHSPHRVEALVFLMMISLTTYFLAQRLYRQRLPDDAPTKERRTTTETIWRAFRTYMLLVHETPLGREIQTTRLTTRQRNLLQHFDFPTPDQTFRQLLPRPPSAGGP